MCKGRWSRSCSHTTQARMQDDTTNVKVRICSSSALSWLSGLSSQVCHETSMPGSSFDFEFSSIVEPQHREFFVFCFPIVRGIFFSEGACMRGPYAQPCNHISLSCLRVGDWASKGWHLLSCRVSFAERASRNWIGTPLPSPWKLQATSPPAHPTPGEVHSVMCTIYPSPSFMPKWVPVREQWAEELTFKIEDQKLLSAPEFVRSQRQTSHSPRLVSWPNTYGPCFCQAGILPYLVTYFWVYCAMLRWYIAF